MSNYCSPLTKKILLRGDKVSDSLCESTWSHTKLNSFCHMCIKMPHVLYQLIFLSVMTSGVPRSWLDSGVFVGEGADRPHSVYPQTRAPLKAGGKLHLGQRLLKPWWLLTVIFSRVHSLRGLPVVRLGASSHPLKQTNCAHKPHSMVSLCLGSVFVHVWVKEVRKQDWGVGEGETTPIVRRCL